MALPFALHLALCPLAVCPLPWQPPPGQNTSFRCQQEQDGDKDGEIRRDGRGRGEEEKGEKREKSSARGEKKKMKATVGIVKDFDKGWQIGGGGGKKKC